MSENPYQSPQAPAFAVADEPQPERGRRPIGIWILSALHLLLGLFAVVAIGFDIRQALNDVSVRPAPPLWVTVLFLGVMGGLSFVSGIGMWLGAKWGWWLGNFICVWSALSPIVEISIFAWSAGIDAVANRQLLIEKGITIIISSLIVLYFFKGTVRDFFGLKSLRMGFALLLLGLVSILVSVAMVGTTIVHFTEAMQR